MNTIYGNALLHNPIFLKQREYWKAKLKTYIPAKDALFSKHINFDQCNEAFENNLFWINKDLTNQILIFCGNDKLTLYAFLVNTLKLVLYYYTDNNAIAIASPQCFNKASLNNADIKPNIVLLFDIYEDELSIAETLDKCSKTVIDAYNNQDYPFEKLFSVLNTTYTLKEYIPEILCAFSNIHVSDNIDRLGVNLNFLFGVEEKGIYCNIKCKKALYPDFFLKNIFEHIENVCNTSIENPDLNIRDLEILSQKEKEQLLFQFNNTNFKYSYEKNAFVLFEEQADRTPYGIAIVFENKHITYIELKFLTNKIANHLLNKGISREDVVCLHIDRSIEMLAAILGTMKVGGAFVPIDPDNPIARKKYILEACKPKIVILSNNAHILNLESDTTQIIINEIIFLNQTIQELYPKINPNQAAYILFTSGSTGNPKGVVIEHKCLNNFIDTFTKIIDFNSKKIILAITTLTFDIFIFETIVPLTKGTKIIVGNELEQKDFSKLIDLIKKECINILQTTPSRLKLLLKFDDALWFKFLSDFIIGGEILLDYVVSMLASKCSCKIFNGYGPTEATVYSTFAELKINEKVTIGKPIQNFQIYILNKKNKILPVGVVGEMYIGGDGVGRGYYNNETLTKEKYLIDPFRNNNRIYKTGDKGRWLADGNIDFIGRSDRQIKIRGYRVELAEIESALVQHPFIKESCVIIKKINDSAILCAYIVLKDSEKKINNLLNGNESSTIIEDQEKNKEIRNFISQKLPEYMMPDKIYCITGIPLTPSNKIDYIKLDTFAIQENIDRTIHEPETKIEFEIAGLFKQILNRKYIDTNDNFFDLGGNSFRVATLLAAIQKNYNAKISFSDIANNATIKKLSLLINEADNKKVVDNNIRIAEKREHYILSFSQVRIYFLQQFYLNSILYNTPFIYKINGILDEKRFSKAVHTIVEQQEALRTKFIIVNGVPRQKISDKVILPIRIEVIQESEITNKVNEFIRSFDIANELPFRIGLFNCIEKRNSILIIDMHHIISDGISLNIFINNLKCLYEGKKVEDLKFQYKDYARYESFEKKINQFSEAEDYWVKMYKNEVAKLKFPFSKIYVNKSPHIGDYVIFEIKEELSNKVKSFAANNQVTLYIFFLSIYNVLLSKLCSQNDVVVGSPVSIRNENNKGIIGNFINTIALRNTISNELSFEKILENVKKTTLLSFDYRYYPFEKLVRQLFNKRGLDNNIFNVMLDYHNEEDGYKQIEIDNIHIELLEDPRKVCLFDLNLHIVEGRTVFNLKLDYDINLFETHVIEIIKNNFINLIEKLIETPSIKFGEIDLNTQKINKNKQFKIDIGLD